MFSSGWRLGREHVDKTSMLRRLFAVGLGTALFALPSCLAAGCQSGAVEYANRLIGADGQLFSVEDLEAIANDRNLTDDEKRQAFRDLGIEDEELIDALLTL